MKNPQDYKLISRTSWWTRGRELFLLTVVFALALVGMQPARAGDAAMKKQVQVPSPTTVSKNANLYDIDATGTDIKFVVEALAQCSGVNIIVGPEVAGPVTAHLKQMSVDAILDCMSTVQGFRWQKTDGTYMLLGKALAEQPEVPALPEEQLLVWQCRYIKAADVAITLQGLFPKLKVVAGPGSVTPTLSSQQGSPVASSGGAAPASGSGQSGSTSGLTSTVLIYGGPDDVALAKDALTQMDKARAQVSIKVAVTELNSNASKELGIDWAFSDIALTESQPASAIKFGKLARDPLSFTGAISALLKNGGGKLLAEPNISVIDGERASILIGDRILYPKLVGYNINGIPIFDKAEENVGIYLQIAAKVGGKGEVTLTLYPQVSLVTSYLKMQGSEYPQISTREAHTTVMVKDGETLSIGGLLRDDDIRSVTKVPLLGDLPIIGGFFRRNKTTRDRSEIVILLTPTIITQD